MENGLSEYTVFFQFILNGLIVGGIYSLVALGYTMVYGTLKFINFAHGEIYMVGGYFGYLFYIQANIPLLIVFPLVAVTGALLGIIIDRVAYKPLRKTSRLAPLISAIGVSIFLRSLIAIIFGSDLRSMQKTVIVQEGIKIFTLRITVLQIVIIIVAVFLMMSLVVFLKYFRLGKAIRATSQDMELAQVTGVSTERVIMATFGIGSLLGALAGVLVGFDQGIEPSMGVLVGFKAFTASVLGGIGNIQGTIVAGFLLGIIENLGAGYISSEYKNAIAFIILILVLLIRPTGIWGRKNHKSF